MLSIICCSVSPDLAGDLYKNISNTIGGVRWEWLCTDNREKSEGICKVYNEAAINAKGDILCFFHDDIIFHTKDWGLKLEEIFNNEQNAGVIGIAGSTLISKTPAGWYNFHLSSENRFYLLQHRPKDNEDIELLNVNPDNESLSKVLVLDGVLMCVKKSVWTEFRFDQENFSEFHFYDIDFTARVAEQYNNFITYDILIEHLSSGILNRSWVENVLKFKKKMKGRLPISLSVISPKDLAEEESQKIIHLLNNMFRFRVDPLLQLDYLFQLMKTDFSGSVKLGLKLLVSRLKVIAFYG